MVGLETCKQSSPSSSLARLHWPPNLADSHQAPCKKDTLSLMTFQHLSVGLQGGLQYSKLQANAGLAKQEAISRCDSKQAILAMNGAAPAWVHYDAQQEAPERCACLQGEAGKVEHPWNRVAEPRQDLHQENFQHCNHPEVICTGRSGHESARVLLTTQRVTVL